MAASTINALGAIENKTVTAVGLSLSFQKIGRICFLNVYGGTTTKALANDEAICAIPEQFKPNGSYIFPIWCNTDWTTSFPRLNVSPSYGLRLLGTLASGKQIRATCVYITALGG